jgi:hypothetical protein
MKRMNDTTAPSWQLAPALLIRLPKGEPARLFLSCRDGAEEEELRAVVARIARALGLTAGTPRRPRPPRLAPWRRPR